MLIYKHLVLSTDLFYIGRQQHFILADIKFSYWPVQQRVNDLSKWKFKLSHLWIPQWMFWPLNSCHDRKSIAGSIRRRSWKIENNKELQMAKSELDKICITTDWTTELSLERIPATVSVAKRSSLRLRAAFLTCCWPSTQANRICPEKSIRLKQNTHKRFCQWWQLTNLLSCKHEYFSNTGAIPPLADRSSSWCCLVALSNCFRCLLSWASCLFRYSASCVFQYQKYLAPLGHSGLTPKGEAACYLSSNDKSKSAIKRPNLTSDRLLTLFQLSNNLITSVMQTTEV